jgi:hypothetical protein
MGESAAAAEKIIKKGDGYMYFAVHVLLLLVVFLYHAFLNRCRPMPPSSIEKYAEEIIFGLE